MFPKVLLGALLYGTLVSTVTLAERLPHSPAGTPVLEFASIVPDAPSTGRSGPRELNRLDAGSLVEVHWCDLPDSVEEVELLLSVDGGRTYSVRLTDELEPGDGSWLWKVPRLDTNAARLAIRMGVDGREVIAAASSPFRIAPDPSAARIRLRWYSGEIWAEADREAKPARPISDGSLSGSRESMTALPEAADALEVPPRMAEHSRNPLQAHRESLVLRSRLVPSSRPFCPSPRAIPQRI
ncbi:MAG: hypothetical protein ABJC61_03460 [Acidobacteriota bacterium]